MRNLYIADDVAWVSISMATNELFHLHEVPHEHIRVNINPCSRITWFSNQRMSLQNV